MKKLWPFEDERAKHQRKFRSHSLISQGVSQLRNTPLAHECHFAAQFSSFLSYEMGCENSPPLRNPPPAAKMIQASKMVCENAALLQNDLQASKWLRNDFQASK